MDLRVDISRSGLSSEEINAKKDAVDAALEKLWSGKEDFTGWVKLPLEYDKNEVERILNVSDIIRQQCSLLIVIGIGGSYLGAKAAIDALEGEPDAPQVKFAGINLSAVYHDKLLKEMASQDVCLCVISKSGTTVETTATFNIFKKALIEKYGKEEAVRRIYAITDEKNGALREETEQEGYTSFVIPGNIGGRYSVLTPVGLLPIAVAGIDIRGLLEGAKVMANSPEWDFDASAYAIARFLLLEKGKAVEAIQHYEPSLRYFVEWIKQLFGESEGKNGTGLFPAGLELTADLHSMGQFLQEGSQIFFETVLNVKNSPVDMTIPSGPLQGKTLNQLNRAATRGVMEAHGNAGIPIIRIDIPELTPFYYGELIYFFENTCAITAMMMGVNPFDQPGVESYKKEMKKEIF